MSQDLTVKELIDQLSGFKPETLVSVFGPTIKGKNAFPVKGVVNADSSRSVCGTITLIVIGEYTDS